MAEMRARWDFVRPWCAPLRGLLALIVRHETRAPSKRFAGVSVRLPSERGTATRGRLRAVGDALVLLSLVARADLDAWRYVLKAHCDLDLDSLPTYSESEDYRTARFEVKLRVAVDSEEWIANMIATLVEEIVAPPSAAFTVAAKKIWKISQEGPRGLDIPIQLAFCTDTGASAPSWTRIQEVLRATKLAHGGWRVPVGMTAVGHIDFPVECAVVLEPMELLLQGDSLSQTKIDAVTGFLRDSEAIPLSYLAITPQMPPSLKISHAQSQQAIGYLLERVFCAGSAAATEVHTIDTVFLSWAVKEEASLARLCSALIEARTVRNLRLSLEPMLASRDIQAKAWSLVAFALFSDLACERSSITHVELIDAIITHEDVDAICAVFSASNPVQHLLGQWYCDHAGSEEPADTSTATTRWMLKRGSPVTLQQMHPYDYVFSDSRTWTLQSDVAGVWLLDNASPDRASVLIQSVK